MGGVACREGFRRSEKTGHSLPAGSVRGPPGMQAFARAYRAKELLSIGDIIRFG